MLTTQQAASYRPSRGGSPPELPLDVDKLRREVEELHEKVARLERTQRARQGAKPARPLPWRARWMPRFLKVLRQTGNVSEAIRAVPRSRKTVYEYRQRCARFAAAWEEALEMRRPEQEDLP